MLELGKNVKRKWLAFIIICTVLAGGFAGILIVLHSEVSKKQLKPWYSKFEQLKDTELEVISIVHFFTQPLDEKTKNADLIIEEVPSGIKATKSLSDGNDFAQLKKYLDSMKCVKEDYEVAIGSNDKFLLLLKFDNGITIDITIHRYTSDSEAAVMMKDTQGISGKYLLSSKENSLKKIVSDIFYQ
jgi:hypothetical protein